jgi:hypothetical protein
MIELIISIVALGSAIGVSKVVYNSASIIFNKRDLYNNSKKMLEDYRNCKHFHPDHCERRGCFFLHECQMKDIIP